MTDEREKPVALVVDDDPVTRRLVSRSLAEFESFHEVLEAADGLGAQALLSDRPDVELVLTDIMMPGIDGLELLRWGRESMPGTAWIILSGLDTFDTAVEAIRLGAFDFLAKPPNIEQLRVSVRNALEQRRLLRERERLATELEAANLHLLAQVRELEEKSALLRLDLQQAEVIQRALLPSVPPQIAGFRVNAAYRPGQHVGGDLYDVGRFRDRYLSFYVADATGHGVTAAMLSVLFKKLLVRVDAVTGEPLEPDRVLDAVNRALCEAVTAPGLFLTTAYGLLDTSTGSVALASAGHPPVLHARADGDTRQIRRTGPALGLSTDARYSTERFVLEPGDRLLLYSDGLLATGSAEDTERLGVRLSEAGQVAENLVTALFEQIDGDDKGASEDPDDATLLLLERRDGPSTFDNGPLRAGGTPSTAVPQSGVVFYGEAEPARYLALRGRATWQHCSGFYHTAVGILAERRPLVIDLSECEYLDSTCLGTLHELVGAGDVRLRGAGESVCELFEELDMARVLDSISDAPPAPELYPLTAGKMGGEPARTRILHAHETLAALSDRNRDRFRTVVQGMRREPNGP